MTSAFLNMTSLLASAEEGGHGASFLGLFIYFGLVLAIVLVALSLAKKSFGERVFKTKPAQLVEQVYVFVEGLCLGAIGPHGRKYVPMIMTLWLVIFVGNIVALFMAASPTADLSFNLAMALSVITYVQWEGIMSHYGPLRAKGMNPVSAFLTASWKHVSHFSGPKLPLAFIPITILLFCIEIISEVMKNVSLSLRLYGNIHGGHEAAETLNKLGQNAFVPLGAFLMPIKLLTCLVQPLIFCLLTCVYIGMVTSHDHDEDHGDHGHGEPATAH